MRDSLERRHKDRNKSTHQLIMQMNPTSRSELVDANLNGVQHGYDYDNIGNRRQAIEGSNYSQYTANNLNQYTDIYGSVNGQEFDFTPTFDDAGNQTLVKTSTGIWSVVYDAENRPISFTNAESATVVECTYDYMGRRATKKVTVNGAVTLHHRYLYRGYLQIACCDLTRSNHPCLWLITWDPTQATATRPLAIQKDATWYTYGWDLTKNICEVYGQHGYIRTNYTYSPFGQVTATGDVTQPIPWSSEYHDTELALVYYNYRHYNPTDGRWLGRDKKEKESTNLYYFAVNCPCYKFDIKGKAAFAIPLIGEIIIIASAAAVAIKQALIDTPADIDEQQPLPINIPEEYVPIEEDSRKIEIEKSNFNHGVCRLMVEALVNACYEEMTDYYTHDITEEGKICCLERKSLYLDICFQRIYPVSKWDLPYDPCANVAPCH